MTRLSSNAAMYFRDIGVRKLRSRPQLECMTTVLRSHKQFISFTRRAYPGEQFGCLTLVEPSGDRGLGSEAAHKRHSALHLALTQHALDLLA